MNFLMRIEGKVDANFSLRKESILGTTMYLRVPKGL